MMKRMIVDQSNFDEAIKLISDRPLVFDVETEDLKIMYGSKICGVGIGTLEGLDFYFPIRHSEGNNLSEDQAKILFNTIASSPIIIAHNIKFDMKALMNEGIKFDRNWLLIDILVMIRLCTKIKFVRVALDESIDHYFGEGSSKYKEDLKIYMRKNKLKKYSENLIEVLGEYCINDIKWERKLFFHLWKELRSVGQVKIWNLEFDVTKVLLEMEYAGVKFDRKYCERGMSLLKSRMGELEKEAYKIAGKEFNAGSTKQLNEVFVDLGVKPVAYTDKGNPKWDAVSLFLTDHDLAKILLNWRSLAKLQSTYFAPPLELNSNIIYCSFKNWKPITGRLSSSEPNLQNIPRTTQRLDEINLFDGEENSERIKFAKQWAERGIKTGKAKSRRQTWEIYEEFDENRNDIISARRLFIPRPGFTLFAMDFAQMEIIVFLSYVKNKRISDMIGDKKFDFHTFIANEVYGCTPEHPDFKFFRQVSKEITYGIIYGMGLETLSLQMGTDINKARKFKTKYFEIIPEAKDFMDSVTNKINQGEAIHNRYGRRYFIDPQKAYLGISYLVQGTSADIVKEGMIKISNYLKDKKTRLLIQVHDEFIVEVSNDEIKYLPKMVSLLENNSINIPLKLEVSECCPSWIQKKKIEDLDEYVQRKTDELQEVFSIS